MPRPRPCWSSCDRERDLGLPVSGAVVAGDGDDLVAELGDERHAVVEVDGREPLELYRGRRGTGEKNRR